MKRSESINELAAALAKAQGKVQGAHKDSTNPHFRSNYADLESCWDACRDALSENGLAVTQELTTQGGGVAVGTLLLHSSGQWLEYEPIFVPSKDDAHGVGSGATYGRRYALCAVVGIAPTDDDANAATGRPAEPVRREEPRREPPKPTPRPATPPVQQAPKAAPAAPKPADPAPAPAVAVKPETPPEKPASVPPAAPATVDNGEKPNQATRTELHRLCLKIGLKSLEAENFCREVTGLPSGKLTQAGAEKLVAALREKAGE